MFLEDRSGTSPRIIDFSRKNEVEIYPGPYKNDLQGKELEQLNVFSCKAEDISEDDSFLSLAEKMGIQIPPELFTAYFHELQKDNTPENFENFQKNSPISVKILNEPKVSNTTNKNLVETLQKKKGN